MNQSQPDLNSAPYTVSLEAGARLTGVGVRQLRGMVEDGTVYAFRSGRAWKIPKASLRKLLGEERAAEARP